MHKTICPFCHREHDCEGRKFKQNLSNGLVITLIKLAKVAKDTGLKPVRIMWDNGPLKGSELGNYTKLRYFRGLIARKEDREQGEWIVTKQGFAFLRGEYKVPKWVVTQNANVVEESPEEVTIDDFKRALYKGERWQTDFLEGLKELPEVKNPQLTLI
jgi:hypothetical protein